MPSLRAAAAADPGSARSLSEMVSRPKLAEERPKTDGSVMPYTLLDRESQWGVRVPTLSSNRQHDGRL